jgi:hypothetical protein
LSETVRFCDSGRFPAATREPASRARVRNQRCITRSVTELCDVRLWAICSAAGRRGRATGTRCQSWADRYRGLGAARRPSAASGWESSRVATPPDPGSANDDGAPRLPRSSPPEQCRRSVIAAESKRARPAQQADFAATAARWTPPSRPVTRRGAKESQQGKQSPKHARRTDRAGSAADRQPHRRRRRPLQRRYRATTPGRSATNPSSSSTSPAKSPSTQSGSTPRNVGSDLAASRSGELAMELRRR